MRHVLLTAIVAAVAALAAAQQVFAAPAPAAPMAPATTSMAIVVRDSTPLRAGAHETSPQQALLWQGETVEVRGERLDYLQVWDYRRERGGFVEAGRVRRLQLTAADAPELLAVLRFVREAPGAEGLGIGLAAAYLKAAPAEVLRGEAGAEVFDAIGTMADRLARRASPNPSPTGAVLVAASMAPPTAAPSRADAALAAHLEVAARYGIGFKSFEQQPGVMRICYDGEAFRRVLAMPEASPVQRARAALGLSRPECIDPAAPIGERQRLEAWRAEVLDRTDTAQLPPIWKGRVAMRRAGVWSGIAFEQARRGEGASAEASGKRALAELASIDRNAVADDDIAAWNEAALRVGASRWAAASSSTRPLSNRAVRIVTTAGEPGETCVSLVAEGKPEGSTTSSSTGTSNGASIARPLAKRCTYGVVWAESATLNREGNALALAVQPLPAWRELWLFTRQANGAWVVQVLPPSSVDPELGYAEFAGWVPGGRQMLVAREARSAKGWKHNFEVLRIETLAIDRQTSEPSTLGPFQRWQDPRWKGETVSVR